MIPPFNLHRPTTVAEATGLLREIEDAALYAGGTELLQVMKLGLARFDHLIDIKKVDEIHGIEAAADGGLRIGATTTHREIERSPLVARSLPALAALESQVANVRVRNVGTLGGNLCFAEPHSDPATLLVAVNGYVELATATGVRTVAVESLLIDMLTTDVRDDELLTAVFVPEQPPGTSIGYHRIALAERPTVSVACRVRLVDGTVADSRLVIGAVGPRPAACAEVASLHGLPVEEARRAARAVAEHCASEAEIADEYDAPVEYKRHLVGVLGERAIVDAIDAEVS